MAMTFKEKVAEALKQGATPEDIKEFIKTTPEWKSATDQNALPNDVWEELGLPPDASRSTAEQIAHTALATPGQIAGGLTKGLMHIPGAIGDMEDLANYLLPQSMQHQKIFPDQQDYVRSLVNPMHLGGAAPENTFEHMTEGTAEGMGAMLPALLSGGSAAPALFAGGLGGAAGTATHLAVPDSTLLPLIAGAAGGSLLQAESSLSGLRYANRMAGILSDNSSISDAALSAAKQNAAEAATEHTNTLDRQAAQNAAQYKEMFDKQNAHNDLIANTRADAAANIDKATSDAQNTITGIANTLSPSKTFEDAGNVGQPAVKNWLNKTMPTAIGNALNPILKAVPDDVVPDASPMAGVFASLNRQLGPLAPLGRQVLPNAPQNLQDAFNAVTKGQEAGVIPQASFANWKNFRTALGDAMSNPRVVNDVGRDRLNALYAGASETMGNALEPLGLRDAWLAANAKAREYYNLAESTMDRVVKSGANNGEDQLPGAAVKSLLNGGKNDSVVLANLRQQVPDFADHLASAAIHSGMWEDLLPNSQAALIPDPQVRATLNASFASKASAAKTFNDAAQSTIDASQAEINALAKSHREAGIDMTDQVNDARFRAHQTKQVVDSLQSDNDVAKAAALALKGNAPDKLIDAIHSISGTLGTMSGGFFGERFGDLAMNALGLPAGMGPTMGVIGSVLPSVTPAMWALARNPQLLKGPALGLAGAASGNAFGLPGAEAGTP